MKRTKSQEKCNDFKNTVKGLPISYLYLAYSPMFTSVIQTKMLPSRGRHVKKQNQCKSLSLFYESEINDR